MSKRPLQETDDYPSKKQKLEDTHLLRRIVIRNDLDPHVYLDSDDEYVKIGNYIYRTKSDPNFFQSIKSDRIIGLSEIQASDVSSHKNDNNKIVITTFDPTRKNTTIEDVEELTVKLSSMTNFKITVKINMLKNHILDLLKNHIVSLGQNFRTQFKGILINIQVSAIDEMTIGKITEETNLDISNFDSNIMIYNNRITLKSKQFKIKVTKCIELSTSKQSNKSIFPIIIDKSILNDYVVKTFDASFSNNDSYIYEKDNLQFTFSISVLVENINSKYKNTYCLDEFDCDNLNIVSTTNNIIITEEEILADKISFNITSNGTEHKIVHVDSLLKYVNKNIEELTENQKFKCEYRDSPSGKNTELSLSVNYIYPECDKPSKYYIVPDETKIVFSTDKKSRVILVQNLEPVSIKKITLKLKKINTGGGIFALLTGNDDDNKNQIFDIKRLEKIIRRKFPKKTSVCYQKKIKYDDTDCIVKVKKLDFGDGFDETKAKESKYTTYGLITDNTEIKFIISRDNKAFTLNDSTGSTMLDNPIEELEKYVGGISKEIAIVVRDICLSRGKWKDKFKQRGLKSPKGIIFHGPPGTGKTSLARELGKLLGCDGERFRLMSGPEVFNKWLGQSEANVREIFKPAKEAHKKHGDNAPIYMVVIDEIDAMLPVRDDSSGNPARSSVVNQFLAEIDGLEQFNNLICVGITNRLELLDPAAIRAGRFGTHVKIGLPDKNGREQIFAIHTSKLKEIGCLGKVNFQKLVEQTDKFSGADIENIVQLASMYSLERLTNLNTDDPIIVEEVEKITHEDFMKAIKEVENINNKSKNTGPVHMYI